MILLIIGFVMSCNQNQLEVPLKGLILGMSESNWKNKVDSLESINIFKNESFSFFGITRNEYSSEIIINKDTLEVNYLLNNDGFYCGKLRTILLKLHNTDSLYISIGSEKRVYKGLSGKKINVLFKYLNHFYGEPDSIIYDYTTISKGKGLQFSGIWAKTYRDKWKNNWHFNASNFFQSQKNVLNDNLKDSVKIENIKIIWDESDFKVAYILLPPIRNEEHIDSILYFNSNIDYKISEYHKHYVITLDSIRNGYPLNIVIRPKVYIAINSINPQFNNGFDREFIIKIPQFEHNAPKENRGIKSIRFNVSVFDRFNDLLYKTNNLEHSFIEPLVIKQPPYNADNMTAITSLSNELNYFLKYSSYSKNETVQNLEYIRLNKNNIKISTETVAIEFSDGTVRK